MTLMVAHVHAVAREILGKVFTRTRGFAALEAPVVIVEHQCTSGTFQLLKLGNFEFTQFELLQQMYKKIKHLTLEKSAIEKETKLPISRGNLLPTQA